MLNIFYWSWLAPFLAWLAHATGKASFFCFELLFSLAFTALFALVAFRRFEDAEARTALVLFFVLPVSATVYFWVSGDSVTLFLIVLALAVPGSWLAALLAGIGLGMQHFEQSFFACYALAFAMGWDLMRGRKANQRYSITWALALVAGVVAGKVLLFLLFQHLNVQVNSGRFSWLHGHLRWLLAQFYFHSQAILYSVLGVGWALIIKLADQGRRPYRSWLRSWVCCCCCPLPAITPGWANCHLSSDGGVLRVEPRLPRIHQPPVCRLGLCSVARRTVHLGLGRHPQVVVLSI